MITSIITPEYLALVILSLSIITKDQWKIEILRCPSTVRCTRNPAADLKSGVHDHLVVGEIPVYKGEILFRSLLFH